MAHPCCICGGECYCSGSWDDVIVDLTPKGCESCEYCQESIEARDALYDDDDSFDDNDYFDEDEFNTQKGDES